MPKDYKDEVYGTKVGVLDYLFAHVGYYLYLCRSIRTRLWR